MTIVATNSAQPEKDFELCASGQDREIDRPQPDFRHLKPKLNAIG
jgi:hypothetical protein